jgi:hypothetical protein
LRTTVTTAGEERIWAIALGELVRSAFQRSSMRRRFRASRVRWIRASAFLAG